MSAGAIQDSNSPAATEIEVQFLCQPTSYPDPTSQVEVVETHMSWVFLTDRYAYKLKKPVRYEFLDFSTLAARQRDCQAELQLNRRLAADVYLDTVPLRVDTTGNLRLGGEGRILDWLVQMRRLPRESMLDWAIQIRTARKIDIEKIALRLAQFYQQSLPVELTPVAYRAQLQEEVRANRRELLQLAVGLPVDTVRAIAADQLAFIADHPDLFDERVRTGRIVEGHGDLRPEHICLAPEPAIIDCLEFKREFRILDAADELAFLALECERLGAPWIGDRVLATYSGVTNDKPPEALVEFYKSYRAYLRAKIAIWHQREPGMANSGKWVARAQTYLDLARQHVPRGA